MQVGPARLERLAGHANNEVAYLCRRSPGPRHKGHHRGHVDDASGILTYRGTPKSRKNLSMCATIDPLPPPPLLTLQTNHTRAAWILTEQREGGRNRAVLQRVLRRPRLAVQRGCGAEGD